jgi:hypothetical protein
MCNEEKLVLRFIFWLHKQKKNIIILVSITRKALLSLPKNSQVSLKGKTSMRLHKQL